MVLLTDDMLMTLWRALVLQVSRLLEVADTSCAKSDRADAFTALLAALRLVVIGQRLSPQQLLVSDVTIRCFFLMPAVKASCYRIVWLSVRLCISTFVDAKSLYLTL